MDSQGVKKRGYYTGSTSHFSFFQPRWCDAIRYGGCCCCCWSSLPFEAKTISCPFCVGVFTNGQVPTLAEECVSPCAKPTETKPTHTHTDADIHAVACHSISIHTSSLIFFSLSLSNKPSFSCWGIWITSGINWISLGDASCTHNTRRLFSLFSSLLYGLCLWHRLTRHRTFERRKEDPLLNRPW